MDMGISPKGSHSTQGCDGNTEGDRLFRGELTARSYLSAHWYSMMFDLQSVLSVELPVNLWMSVCVPFGDHVHP